MNLTKGTAMRTIDDLPDDRYYDGTYEWDKEGDDWTPLRAPSGMPSRPRFEGLKRVVTIYVGLDEPEWEYGRDYGENDVEEDDYSEKLTTHRRRASGPWIPRSGEW